MPEQPASIIGSHASQGDSVKIGILTVSICLIPLLAPAQNTHVRLTAAGSAPMTWRADLFGSLGSLSIDTTNRWTRLTSPDTPSKAPAKVALRALKTLAFDLPVSWYFVSWNHEYGHITRATEAGIDVSLTLVGTPWTYPRFDLVATSVYPRLFVGPMFDLATESGGLEAVWVMKDRLEREARTRPLTVGEALMVVWSSLDTPLYAQVNTPADLFQQIVPSGDVARYAHQWLRDTTRQLPGSHIERLTTLRRRALLNLLDVGMLSTAFGVIHDYVWLGRDAVTTRALTVRRVGITPALRYSLTPLGPELSVRTNVRMHSSEWAMYYRSTEATSATGFGLEFSRTFTPSVEPRVQLDFWSQPTTGRGSRQEISLRLRPRPLRSVGFVDVALARKSAGYLQGQPLRAAVQFTSSLGYRW